MKSRRGERENEDTLWMVFVWCVSKHGKYRRWERGRRRRGCAQHITLSSWNHARRMTGWYCTVLYTYTDWSTTKGKRGARSSLRFLLLYVLLLHHFFLLFALSIMAIETSARRTQALSVSARTRYVPQPVTCSRARGRTWRAPTRVCVFFC